MGFFQSLAGTPSETAAGDAPLSPSDVALVQASFAKVAPIADDAATLFYGRLFEIAPETRALFKGAPGSEPMTAQGAKLMATLGVVVNGLKDLDAIAPAAKALAVRHVDYGVTAAHYAPVGAALLWTLEQGLGDGFAPDVAAAWTKAYAALSDVMVEAAYGDGGAAA